MTIRSLLPSQVAAKLNSTSLLVGCGLSLFAIMTVLLSTTNPLSIGPNGILLFFLVLYLLGVVIALAAIKGWQALFGRSVPNLKSFYLASVTAFAPVMLLALNTLNQLQAIDAVLVVAFELLALFYIFRRIE